MGLEQFVAAGPVQMLQFLLPFAVGLRSFAQRFQQQIPAFGVPLPDFLIPCKGNGADGLPEAVMKGHIDRVLVIRGIILAVDMGIGPAQLALSHSGQAAYESKALPQEQFVQCLDFLVSAAEVFTGSRNPASQDVRRRRRCSSGPQNIILVTHKKAHRIRQEIRAFFRRKLIQCRRNPLLFDFPRYVASLNQAAELLRQQVAIPHRRENIVTEVTLKFLGTLLIEFREKAVKLSRSFFPGGGNCIHRTVLS